MLEYYPQHQSHHCMLASLAMVMNMDPNEIAIGMPFDIDEPISGEKDEPANILPAEAVWLMTSAGMQPTHILTKELILESALAAYPRWYYSNLPDSKIAWNIIKASGKHALISAPNNKGGSHAMAWDADRQMILDPKLEEGEKHPDQEPILYDLIIVNRYLP